MNREVPVREALLAEQAYDRLVAVLRDGTVAAGQFLSMPGLVELLANGHLVVGHRWLIQQCDVFEVPIQPTFDDLRKSLLRLALLLRGRLGDAPFVLDQLAWHLVTADILRAHCGDLHRDATGGRCV